MNLKETGKKFKENLPIVYFVFKNSSTPLFSKILAGITIGYALSPIDLIPDFIPIIGYLDDLVILPFLIYVTMKSIPESILVESKAASIDFWTNNKSKNWLYAIPILFIWAFIIYIVIKKLL